MNDREFENQIREITRGLEYPDTPDMAGTLRSHKIIPTPSRFAAGQLARSLILVIVLLASLMLIPQARAVVMEYIQIGAVKIFSNPTEVVPTPLTHSIATQTPSASSSSLLSTLTNMAGETDLASASAMAPYPILLPTYPNDIGEPDRVYVQESEGMITILIWLDPQRSDRVLMSLHFVPSGNWSIYKSDPILIEETLVNGKRAVWTEGPYPLIMSDGNVQFERLVEGHVLIWTDGDITYRLETNQTMDEAIKVAGSLSATR